MKTTKAVFVTGIYWFKPTNGLQHVQKVASGDEFHDKRAISILHNHTQQLDHSLMVQARHDLSLLQ